MASKLNPLLSENCSPNFTYEDFISCSDSFKKNSVSNLPEEQKTFDAINKMANQLLEPIQKKFGEIKLTYGFCGPELQKIIKKGVYPKTDQHSGFELNKNGNLICERGGFAVDFLIPNLSSLQLARWIVDNLKFDKLYYYGDARPIHLSQHDFPLGQIILMKFYKKRVVPRKIKRDLLFEEIDF